jgi:hypothetical protein
MNAISDPALLVLNGEHRSAAGSNEAAVTHTLRRTGRKAVRFQGWQLIEAIGSDGNRDVWHDLNIYRTVKDAIVVELIVRRGLEGQQDTCHVKTFEDLPAAAAWLENYPAAEDAPIPPGLGSNDIALAWAVLQAVQLRQCIDRLASNYQTLLTEVFAALELTDPPDAQPVQAQRKAACKP